MIGWDDDSNADDYLGALQYDGYWTSSTWATLRHTLSGSGRYFEIKYRFTCNTNYYGNLCTVYCRARNDYYGHYTCSSSGSKVCNSGWTGTNCNNGKYI